MLKVPQDQLQSNYPDAIGKHGQLIIDYFHSATADEIL